MERTSFPCPPRGLTGARGEPETSGPGPGADGPAGRGGEKGKGAPPCGDGAESGRDTRGKGPEVQFGRIERDSYGRIRARRGSNPPIENEVYQAGIEIQGLGAVPPTWPWTHPGPASLFDGPRGVNRVGTRRFFRSVRFPRASLEDDPPMRKGLLTAGICLLLAGAVGVAWAASFIDAVEGGLSENCLGYPLPVGYEDWCAQQRGQLALGGIIQGIMLLVGIVGLALLTAGIWLEPKRTTPQSPMYSPGPPGQAQPRPHAAPRAGKYCPACGVLNDAGALFCQACGARQP